VPHLAKLIFATLEGEQRRHERFFYWNPERAQRLSSDYLGIFPGSIKQKKEEAKLFEPRSLQSHSCILLTSHTRALTGQEQLGLEKSNDTRDSMVSPQDDFLLQGLPKCMCAFVILRLLIPNNHFSSLNLKVY
jgi:hypothetical protein